MAKQEDLIVEERKVEGNRRTWEMEGGEDRRENYNRGGGGKG